MKANEKLRERDLGTTTLATAEAISVPNMKQGQRLSWFAGWRTRVMKAIKDE